MTIGEIILILLVSFFAIGCIAIGIVNYNKSLKEEQKEAEAKRLEEERIQEEKIKRLQAFTEHKHEFLQKIQECCEIPTLLFEASENIKKAVIQELERSLLGYEAVSINYYEMELNYFNLSIEDISNLIANGYNEISISMKNLSEEEIQKMKSHLSRFYEKMNEETTLLKLCEEYLKTEYVQYYTKQLIDIIEKVNENFEAGFDEYVKQHPEAYQIAQQNKLLKKQNVLIADQTNQLAQYNKDVQDAIDRQTRAQAFSAAAIGMAILNN